MTTVVQQPQEVELKEVALTIVQQAQAIVIADQASYDKAADFLLTVIVPFRKNWRRYWHGSDDVPGPIKLAYRAYDALLEKFNEHDKPAEQAERAVKQSILNWDQAQVRLQNERQRKAQQEAEEREESERLAAMVLAEESGATQEQLKQIASAAVPVVAEPVAPTYRAAAGISKPRENWCAEVKDFKALVKAVAAGKVPLEYLLPNEKALNSRAKADRGTMNIPGVIAKNNPNLATRTK